MTAFPAVSPQESQLQGHLLCHTISVQLTHLRQHSPVNIGKVTGFRRDQAQQRQVKWVAISSQRLDQENSQKVRVSQRHASPRCQRPEETAPSYQANPKCPIMKTSPPALVASMLTTFASSKSYLVSPKLETEVGSPGWYMALNTSLVHHPFCISDFRPSTEVHVRIAEGQPTNVKLDAQKVPPPRLLRNWALIKQSALDGWALIERSSLLPRRGPM